MPGHAQAGCRCRESAAERGVRRVAYVLTYLRRQMTRPVERWGLSWFDLSCHVCGGMLGLSFSTVADAVEQTIDGARMFRHARRDVYHDNPVRRAGGVSSCACSGMRDGCFLWQSGLERGNVLRCVYRAMRIRMGAAVGGGALLGWLDVAGGRLELLRRIGPQGDGLDWLD